MATQGNGRMCGAPSLSRDTETRDFAARVAAASVSPGSTRRGGLMTGCGVLLTFDSRARRYDCGATGCVPPARAAKVAIHARATQRFRIIISPRYINALRVNRDPRVGTRSRLSRRSLKSRHASSDIRLSCYASTLRNENTMNNLQSIEYFIRYYKVL